ncbi:MAG: hypothetical protein KC910_28525 [Candidatus Eremiobacteraeota bacterium]|nr:hypothetical protein [Candidatus Eremiobacteraeota bacterium]
MLTRLQGLFEEICQSLSVEQLYHSCDDLLMSLKADPQPAEQVRASARAARAYLAPELARQAVPGPREAATVGLKCLAAGMLSGLLDGVLLYTEGQPPDAFRPEVDGKLRDKAEVMAGNLEDIVRVAQQNWARSDADSLQLLSGYGRHENRLSDQEALALAASPGLSLFEFQTFLLATFKGGYAMGMADAAVVFVAGERPGQAPE